MLSFRNIFWVRRRITFYQNFDPDIIATWKKTCSCNSNTVKPVLCDLQIQSNLSYVIFKYSQTCLVWSSNTVKPVLCDLQIQSNLSCVIFKYSQTCLVWSSNTVKPVLCDLQIQSNLSCVIFKYNQTCLVWSSNTVKPVLCDLQIQSNLSYVIFQGKIEILSHKVVAKCRFKSYEMYWEWKLKWRSHNTSYCLIEVVTKAG